MSIHLSQRLQIGGITLELSACISPEALQCAAGDSEAAAELLRISGGSLRADPLLLMAPMQQTLARGLEALRESLAEQALALLQDNFVELREAYQRSRASM